MSVDVSQLGSVLDATGDGVLVLDRQRRIVIITQRFSELWGIPDALVGSGDVTAILAFMLDQVVDPDSMVRPQRLYELSAAESVERLRLRDDRVFEQYLRPVWVGAEVVGRIWGVRDISLQERAAMAVDATSEVESQVQLRRAEGLYRGLVEKLPGVTYLWGPAGKCTYASPQVAEVFGCSEQAFGEGAWRDAIVEEDLESVIDQVRNEHAADRGAHVEYRIHHLRTGEERWLTEQTTLVTVDQETLVQGLILDVTPQVRAAQVLEERENERRRLVASLLRAAEAERASLATELHDDTIQVLAAALLTIDQIRADLSHSESTTATRIESLRSLLAQAMERTRTLMFDVNPQLLQSSGLTAAIRALATQLGKEGGFEAIVEGEVGRFSVEFEALAYRIVREAVINANKHAHCSQLHVHLRTTDGHLECSISDNGIGFTPDRALTREDAPMHFGLRSAIERVRIADGTLTIASSPGQGTTIQLRLPTPEASG